MPIFKQQQFKRLQNQQSAEGGDGGGGVTITPELQAIIDAKVSEAVGGLKTKNGELLGKLKDAATNLQRFDGIDPVAVTSMLKRFENDDEAKLIASGKIDEVLSNRTARMKADYEKQMGEIRAVAEKSVSQAKAYQGQVLDNAIRAATSTSGIHAQAIDDALFQARAIFTLDDAGNAVSLGADGQPVFGKDGKTPFSPAEWLDGMKEKKPHWWPASASGGGASGSGGSMGAPKGNLGGDKTERVNALKSRFPELRNQ